MSSPAIQDFNQKFSQFPEFRQKIADTSSVPELMTVLQEWGCQLTGPQIVTLAQQAYQDWLAFLSPTAQRFFVESHENETLNKAIETCKSPEDVMALAKTHGFSLSKADLQTAAIAAAKIEGFSFEKLWFKQLGLLT